MNDDTTATAIRASSAMFVSRGRSPRLAALPSLKVEREERAVAHHARDHHQDDRGRLHGDVAPVDVGDVSEQELLHLLLDATRRGR